ncbi:MAG: phospholipase D-like domain-containing protein [Phycisphaerales bacterium]|nr:phospholipase D-like domain-containing protein [Phycisphaerales bacterium]MCI0630260.1 phospholipase D-like domain-containing protein [Phycisphaerales bacterium]MCI0676695.1 phospholipase D-like domain-containing protein [Phycisphaerales bacterium]
MPRRHLPTTPDLESEPHRPPQRNPALRRLRAALRQAIAIATDTSRRLRSRGQRLRLRRQPTRERAARRSEAHTREGFDQPASFARHWEHIVSRLLMFGGASSGNSVILYCDGDALFEDLWQAIDDATRQIWFEMYTIEPDRVGMRTLEALTAAAKRGCNVFLLCDAVGSSNLTEAMLRPLRQAGGRAEIFNPIWRWKRPAPLLRRDHRKIIIIDGRIGYCGGMNVSEDYAGKKYGNSLFRDCHMRLQGPGVRDLAAILAKSWRIVTKQRLTLPKSGAPLGDTFVQVLSSAGWSGRRAIQRALRLTTRRSLKHCYVTTPYFIPPQRLIRALTRSARRGVDVRVLTAGKSDVPAVAMAARHIYGVLLHHGVRIFEMHGSTLHAKTITIDGLYSTVGSFNLDTWSDKHNLEVNIAMIDSTVASRLQSDFLDDIKRSTEITLDNWAKRSWMRRIVHWLAYQLLRF